MKAAEPSIGGGQIVPLFKIGGKGPAMLARRAIIRFHKLSTDIGSSEWTSRHGVVAFPLPNLSVSHHHHRLARLGERGCVGLRLLPQLVEPFGAFITELRYRSQDRKAPRCFGALTGGTFARGTQPQLPH